MDNKSRIIVFPGQGTQHVGMCKELHSNHDEVKSLLAYIDKTLGYSLSDIMFNGPADLLSNTAHAQVAIMATSCASFLVHSKNKDIKDMCSYVAGHSVGEYCAIYAAKVISLDALINLLQKRGQYMQECCVEGTGMWACIGFGEDNIKNIIDSITHMVCSIANYNAFGQIVVSGELEAMEYFQNFAKDHPGTRVIQLKVSGAFHSPFMQKAQDKMAEILLKEDFDDPAVPVIMNTSAEPCKYGSFIRYALLDQITKPVKWRQIMTYAESKKLDVVECDPGTTLINMLKRDQYLCGIDPISMVDF